MGLLSCEVCEVLKQQIVSLRAQLSDQQELILKLQQSHAESHKSLIDRILALTSPPALREARREGGQTGESQSGLSGSPPRLHFPGLHIDRRPASRPPVDPRKPEGQTS